MGGREVSDNRAFLEYLIVRNAMQFPFGSGGRPHAPLEKYSGQVAGIPVRTDHVRSLNLSTAAGIVVYEAPRQTQVSAR